MKQVCKKCGSTDIHQQYFGWYALEHDDFNIDNVEWVFRYWCPKCEEEVGVEEVPISQETQQ